MHSFLTWIGLGHVITNRKQNPSPEHLGVSVCSSVHPAVTWTHYWAENSTKHDYSNITRSLHSNTYSSVHICVKITGKLRKSSIAHTDPFHSEFYFPNTTFRKIRMQSVLTAVLYSEIIAFINHNKPHNVCKKNQENVTQPLFLA